MIIIIPENFNYFRIIPKKFNYFSLIPCNIYGPNDKFDTERGHVIGSLVNKIYHAKINSKFSLIVN